MVVTTETLYCPYYPLRWLGVLIDGQLPPCAHAMAVYIWHRAGIERKGVDLTITRQKVFQGIKLSPNSIRRGLNALEAAGLITTKRGAGKGIRISIADYETYNRRGVKR